MPAASSTFSKVRAWHGEQDRRRFRTEGLWGEDILSDVLDRHADAHPDKLAVADAERHWSYGELRSWSRRMASVLLELGARPGEVIGAQLPSCALLPVVHLACNRIGAIFLPLSTTWRRAEIGALLRTTEATIAIVPGADGSFDFLDMLAQLRGELPALRSILSARCDRDDDIEALATAAPDPDDGLLTRLRPSADDVCSVMSTSGSTGLPKVSVWSANNLMTLVVH